MDESSVIDSYRLLGGDGIKSGVCLVSDMKVKFLIWALFSVWGLLSVANEINEPDVRIVGGSPAGSNEFPYFILFDGCAATLVHEDIALTAAHVSAHHSFLWRRVSTE